MSAERRATRDERQVFLCTAGQKKKQTTLDVSQLPVAGGRNVTQVGQYTLVVILAMLVIRDQQCWSVGSRTKGRMGDSHRTSGLLRLDTVKTMSETGCGG